MCECHGHGAEIDRHAGALTPSATRRAFLLIGLGALAGCARQAAVSTMPTMPSPPWDEAERRAAAAGAAPVLPAPAPQPRRPAPTPGVLPRSTWARGNPVPSQMNMMTTIRYITVHHDGMEPFFATDKESAAAHIELIRRLHRRKGWGDIGYHFAVDRGGRVWEARPLRYQGAHVKDHNPGNIGIVVLGNFEEQSPTEAQLEGLQRHIIALRRQYRITLDHVQSHHEWGANTACPGERLQVYLDRMRRSGALG